MGEAIKFWKNYWALKYLSLWFPGLRKVFWKICKTLRPPPPTYLMYGPLYQFWNDNSIPLQTLYPYSMVWKITPLYFFSSKNVYFAQREYIKLKMFETLQCLGQNSSNSSCKFWSDKSIPLQILHHFLLSWLITPL